MSSTYVVKPFAPRELVARLSAVLRRAERHDTEPRFAVDGLLIDLAARVVRHEDARPMPHPTLPLGTRAMQPDGRGPLP